MAPSRRRVLATAAASGLAALAGCSAVSSVLPDGYDAGEPTYRQWVHPDAWLVNHRVLYVIRPGDVESVSDSLDEAVRFRTWIQQALVPPSVADTVIWSEQFELYGRLATDRDAAIQALTEDDHVHRPDLSTDDYDLFVGADVPYPDADDGPTESDPKRDFYRRLKTASMVVVTDDVVGAIPLPEVRSERQNANPEAIADHVRSLPDEYAGPDVESWLMDSIGTPTYGRLNLNDHLPGVVDEPSVEGYATGFDVGPETTHLRFSVGFDTERHATESFVTEWIEGDDSPDVEPYDYRVQEKGRLVVVQGKTETENVDWLEPGSPG